MTNVTDLASYRSQRAGKKAGKSQRRLLRPADSLLQTACGRYRRGDRVFIMRYQESGTLIFIYKGGKTVSVQTSHCTRVLDISELGHAG